MVDLLLEFKEKMVKDSVFGVMGSDGAKYGRFFRRRKRVMLAAKNGD